MGMKSHHRFKKLKPRDIKLTIFYLVISEWSLVFPHILLLGVLWIFIFCGTIRK